MSGCCAQFLFVACRPKERKGHLCIAKSYVLERRSRSSSTGVTLVTYGKREIFGRLLAKHEFEPGLWTWAGSYLKEDPATFLKRGESFLTKVRQRFSDRRGVSDSWMVNGVTVRASANRKLALGRFEDRVREYWDNQHIPITKNGDFRNRVHKDQRGLKLRTVARLYSIVQKAEKDLTIHFAYEGITLKLGEKFVFEKSREKIEKLKERVEWIKQLNKEVAIRKCLKKEKQTINPIVS